MQNHHNWDKYFRDSEDEELCGICGDNSIDDDSLIVLHPVTQSEVCICDECEKKRKEQ